MFADDQIERYSRQIILPEVGGKGQENILRSRVYVDADGRVATSALFYLAAAGVGTIGVGGTPLDPAFSMLAGQRANEPPIVDTLSSLNPDCSVVVHADDATQQPERLIQQYDLILATTDALHDQCYAQYKPFVWVSVSRDQGHLFVSRGDKSDWPCLRCLALDASVFFDTREAMSKKAGGESAFAFFLGAQLTTEVLKIIVQADADSRPKLVTCTFPAFHLAERTVEKNPHCSTCARTAH